jgi:hypothetical protein
MDVLPTSEGVDKHVFNTLGVQPYEPTSFIGKLLQAGVTGAGAGLVDPSALLGIMKAGTPLASVLEGALPRMAKTAVAADAANASQQAFPDQPGLAAGAALLAHTGAGTAGRLATTGKNIVAPLWNPDGAAKDQAGRIAAQVDNSKPGLANPDQRDFDVATATTKAATDAFNPCLDDYTSGGNIRDDLQSRRDVLSAQRSAAGDKAYDAFRAQPALPAAAVEPLMRSPGFRKAVSAASTSLVRAAVRIRNSSASGAMPSRP